MRSQQRVSKFQENQQKQEYEKQRFDYVLKIEQKRKELEDLEEKK
jgi:hypothetical protein